MCTFRKLLKKCQTYRCSARLYVTTTEPEKCEAAANGRGEAGNCPSGISEGEALIIGEFLCDDCRKRQQEQEKRARRGAFSFGSPEE
jgi:hypothetical protein